MPIPLLAAAAIPSVIKGGLGIYQMLRSNNIQPKQLSPEMQERLATARNLASANMPGYALAQQNINNSTAGAVNNMRELSTSGIAKLGTLAGINANQNEALDKLDMNNTQFQASQMQNLQNTLQDVSNKKEQFQNEADGAKSALLGAGIQNIQGGISDVAGMYVDEKNNQQLLEALKTNQNLFGMGNQQQGTSTTGVGNNFNFNPNNFNPNANPNFFNRYKKQINFGK